MGRKTISESEYKKKRSGGNATRNQSLLKVEFDALRNSKGTFVPLVANNGKNYGNISVNAYQAIRYNNLDLYNPVNEKEKSAIDSYIKDNFKDDTGKNIVTSLDEYKNKVKQEKDEYEKNKPRNANILDTTWRSLKRGYYRSLYGIEAWKNAQGQKNEKDKYKKILESDEYKFAPDNVIEEAVSGGMELLGQQFNQWTNRQTIAEAGTMATSLAGVTAIAGQAGPQIAIPEEIITVPGAAIIGGTIGFAHGSAMVNYQIEAGLAYEEMIENGISSETARTIATCVGGANSLLETIQLDDLIKSFKIVSELDATDGFIKKFGNYLKKRGVFVTKETAEEVTQEAVTIGGVQGANKLEKGEWAYSKDEVGKRLMDTAISSALSFAFTGGTGDVTNSLKSKYQKTNAYKSNISNMGAELRKLGAIQSVFDTGLESPKDSRSYKLAEKADKKYKQNGKISDFEIGQVYEANVEQVEAEQAKDLLEEQDRVKREKIAAKDEAPTENTNTIAPTAEKSTIVGSTSTFTDEHSELMDTEMPSVSVGESFHDTKTGNTITVISRDDSNTVVEINTGTKTETRTYTNKQADRLAVSDQYTQIERTDTVETVSEPAAENDIPAVRNISLTRVGDFYEAYGNEAVELANKLGLTLATKNVNGASVQMVGFPVSSLENYSNILGADYNIKITDTAPVTSINEQNMHVTDENTGKNTSVTNTDVHSTENEISVVINAVNDTLYPEAKSDILNIAKKNAVDNGIEVFAENLKKEYEQKGTIERYSAYFTDSGKKVVDAINSITPANAVDEKVNEMVDKVEKSVDDSDNAVENTPSNDNTADVDNDNTPVETETDNDNISLTEKCELIATKHTETGENLWIVTLKDKLSKDEYKDLSAKVKAVGGYYSRFAKTPEGKAIPGFVFKTEPTENQTAVFNEFFDSQNKVLKNENVDDIIETNTITENEVQDNVTIESGSVLENDERHSEMQATEGSEAVQNRGPNQAHRATEGRNHEGRYRDVSSRTQKSESRELKELIGLEKFAKLSSHIGNEITNQTIDELEERYVNDSRLNDGYDFSEIVAYDMLTDPNNELRIAFADNIAEYFNESTDTTVDSTGESVASDILKATKNSVVKNERGQLILVYHGTDKVFALFKFGDIGFHFGSYYQAVQRVKANEVESPIFIRAYLNIENPLIVDEDFYGWNAFQIAQKLSKMGVISEADSLSYLEESKNDVAKANEKLRNHLKELGYDGIIYTNDKEAGNGTSYIVFDNEQIFRTDNASNESIDEEGAGNDKSKSSVLEGESESESDIIDSNNAVTNNQEVRYSLDESYVSDNISGRDIQSLRDALTSKEWKQFYNSLYKLAEGKWFPSTKDGQFVFETDNKLVFSDGDYSNPSVSKIIKFEGFEQDEVEYAKELIWNEAMATESSEEFCEVAQLMSGKGAITETDFRNGRAYRERTHSGSEGNDGRTANQESEKDVSYSLESEEMNSGRGDLLSDGSGKRKDRKSSRKSAKGLDGRTSRYREGRTTAYERREYCRTLKAAGNTKQEVIHGHQCEVIPEEHYTDRMRKIAELNKERGFDETVFIIGKATIPFVKDSKGNSKTARGVLIDSNGKKTVIVQYDNEFATPEQINDHEQVHNAYRDLKTQKARNIILNSLSVVERKSVLEKLSRDYHGIIEGNEEQIFEEFIANVLSGQGEYAPEFNDLTRAYWNNSAESIDKFEVSEYTELIDSGGSTNVMNDNGVGNENGLLVKDNADYVFPPYNEYPYSDANERSTRWAHREDINEFTQRIMFFDGRPYLIEKDTTLPLKYRIVRVITEEHKSAAERFIEERTHNNERDTGEQLRGKRTVQDSKHNRGQYSYGRGDLNDRYSTDRHSEKTRNVQTMGEQHYGEWDGADERSRVVKQSVGNKSVLIDSGTLAEDILDTIGFADELSIGNGIAIPYNESVQLREYIMLKNNSIDKLETIDCTEIGNNFYIWKNQSKTDYTVSDMIPLDGNTDLINDIRGEISNGTYRSSESSAALAKRVWSGGRSNNRYNGRAKETGAHRYDVGLSVGQSESDTSGNIRGSGSNKTFVKYSLDTAETDAEELTPERKKEIFEQFEQARVGVDKPTQKQLWGERATWVAHNATRVFPNIPERGERGTFFAEFRKNMIQWKNLPTTASFMAQDKLNKMTEGLTPEEFRTFSELVYFLDLQEEAQIQKERGFSEILLPNGISPDEVNAIVRVLNEEATENVQQALVKRREIWDTLKNQYTELNRYIGFDTDGKFQRKNYYHHQVIDYMNSDSKGTGSRGINIKAGRGWLKERQGSTKAINTDFLAVEYKAMLQMQYDIYIAETLGRIKKQYDIKPQLEKQAFTNNKKLLNDLIIEEATGEDGNVRYDIKGNPDSEIYRQQKWYNQRIMFGFSDLFDLAENNDLPTFDGAYSAVVEALKRHDLNIAGLYKYVGMLANTDNIENLTDEQEQAAISARTVLKYTSQKKAWARETLGDKYQTWETIAESMSDTHTIHQPRRGNYFYTKTVNDEEIFNSAFNEMVVNLAAGEGGIETTDEMKQLFVQYSDTIRLMGAAFEQWVLPNEIVDTMSDIANPKQASEGAKVARSIVSAWKGWSTSINPLRTVKFGIRNLIGDLDAVIAGNPRVVMYSKKAAQEIYQAMCHKNYSREFMEWLERGGYTSMIFANEMDSEMQDKLFSHLKEKQGVNIFKIPVKLFEKYTNGVENVHNFREAILRYSSYLYFKEAINRNDGNVKDYVASNKYIVRGLNTVEDKAYQLSKDLLGAYDEVGKLGQTLRRYWVPFYSFTETNMKRYYRMFENLITSEDTIPKKTGKLLLKGLMVNMLSLLMVAWNKLVMRDDDEELPPSVRNVPHLTLGKIGDNIYAFRQLGSFAEILEWLGLEDYQWTKEDLMAPLDKAWGMITPFLKLPIELVSGLNFYPSLSEPRAIRDKLQHFFNSFGVDDLYSEITGKPTRGLGEIIKGGIVYNYDYKESAYYEILDIKREYQGKTDNTIYGSDARSNALYYMKTAVRYKDEDAALKYLDEYFENGGTVKGIKQAFATLNPMYGYTGKDTIEKGEAFVKSLTSDEREKLQIAQDYYENDLMLPEDVLAKLGRKGITDEEAKNVLKGYIKAKCK